MLTAVLLCGCMQALPKSVARLTPAQRGISAGAFQRKGPMGGKAYGIPLKTLTVPSPSPSSVPAGASTTGALAAHQLERERQTAMAAETTRRQITRFIARLLQGWLFPGVPARHRPH